MGIIICHVASILNKAQLPLLLLLLLYYDSSSNPPSRDILMLGQLKALRLVISKVFRTMYILYVMT